MHQKLSSVQASKLFYKQQWTNALRDLEAMRSEGNLKKISNEDTKHRNLTVALYDNR